jgi:hypothetical protein
VIFAHYKLSSLAKVVSFANFRVTPISWGFRFAKVGRKSPLFREEFCEARQKDCISMPEVSKSMLLNRVPCSN